MSYTQTEISRSVCNEKNPLLPQNAQVGEAFRTQLLNKFSMSTVANQLRNANEDDERVDCDSQDVDFNPMDVDDDESDSAEHRDDQESLPKRYRSKMKRYEKFKNKQPDPPGSELPERFEYVGKNVMSAQATAYAELLKICSKHDASKTMYDDIANWAQHWSSKDPNTLRAATTAQRWTRKKMLNHLKDVFPFKGLDPTTYVVELHDGRTVSVPVVDFADAMRSILNDKEVMKFVMKGIDPTTFRPYKSTEEHESDPDAVIDDKDSGWLFRQGIKLHCPDSEDIDPKKVRPFPILMHIDCSHSDLFGNLKVAPVQVMPAILDVNVQQTSGHLQCRSAIYQDAVGYTERWKTS